MTRSKSLTIVQRRCDYEYNVRSMVNTSASFAAFKRQSFFRTNEELIVKTLVGLTNESLGSDPSTQSAADTSIVCGAEVIWEVIAARMRSSP